VELVTHEKNWLLAGDSAEVQENDSLAAADSRGKNRSTGRHQPTAAYKLQTDDPQLKSWQKEMRRNFWSDLSQLPQHDNDCETLFNQVANNESSKVFDIIKPGRRVKIKGHWQ